MHVYLGKSNNQSIKRHAAVAVSRLFGADADAGDNAGNAGYGLVPSTTRASILPSGESSDA